jgi:hypothetical protein
MGSTIPFDDQDVNGMIKCDRCPKTFTTRGKFKSVLLLLYNIINPNWLLQVAATTKLIPSHTVVSIATKDLHSEAISIDIARNIRPLPYAFTVLSRVASLRELHGKTICKDT